MRLVSDGAVELSGAEARRLALAAPGVAGPRPAGGGGPRPAGRAALRQVRRVLGDVGILQLDSVNVLSRAHYLPLFSRLGPYPREAIDRLTHHEPAGARGGGPGGGGEGG